MLEVETVKSGGSAAVSHMVDRVILTGFRATGKSVVGRVLAEQIGYSFVDTDQELAAEMQCSVSDFVGSNGWSAFRSLERKLLKRLAGVRQTVIATGGGMILHQEQWQRLRSGSFVVWLKADAETIRRRLREDEQTADQRPSLTGQSLLAEVDTLLAEREPLYRLGSDAALDTAGHSPEELVGLIKELLQQSRAE